MGTIKRWSTLGETACFLKSSYPVTRSELWEIGVDGVVCKQRQASILMVNQKSAQSVKTDAWHVLEPWLITW